MAGCGVIDGSLGIVQWHSRLEGYVCIIWPSLWTFGIDPTWSNLPPLHKRLGKKEKWRWRFGVGCNSMLMLSMRSSLLWYLLLLQRAGRGRILTFATQVSWYYSYLYGEHQYIRRPCIWIKHIQHIHNNHTLTRTLSTNPSSLPLPVPQATVEKNTWLAVVVSMLPLVQRSERSPPTLHSATPPFPPFSVSVFAIEMPYEFNKKDKY